LWVLDPIDGTKSFITGAALGRQAHGTAHMCLTVLGLGWLPAE
jgi:hypothetical protein